ncbi:hypothetical protein PG985_010149 [Apiospora marii]|uniref:Uncharacterized protein n=1 Tax=Apiospora marii TaxID=335849 RepID=A0ABR1RLD2_9PEZI
MTELTGGLGPICVGASGQRALPKWTTNCYMYRAPWWLSPGNICATCFAKHRRAAIIRTNMVPRASWVGRTSERRGEAAERPLTSIASSVGASVCSCVSVRPAAKQTPYGHMPVPSIAAT